MDKNVWFLKRRRGCDMINSSLRCLFGGRRGNRWQCKKRTRPIPSSHPCVFMVLVLLLYAGIDITRDLCRIDERSTTLVFSFILPYFTPRSAAMGQISIDKHHLLSPSQQSSLIESKQSPRYLNGKAMELSMTLANTTSPSHGFNINEGETTNSPKMSIIRTSAPIKNKKNTNFIPPEELDQLLDKIDIVALVESYGLRAFQKSSPYHAKCICPFHDDSNPSLQINGERGIYKCFSCGAGGNALKFVREYSALYDEPKDSESSETETGALTFVDAVNVLKDFASKTRSGARPRQRQAFNESNGRNQTVTKRRKASLVGRTPRGRILHANLFAAAYFEENLFGLPSAGLARTHLRERGIQPSTVKAYAIGFAPECYFSDRSLQQSKTREWGEGSLVHKLRDEGFTPQEMLDAGLAILTKKGRDQQEQSESRGQSSDHESLKKPYEHKDFGTIMDRFRGRLVVPIFDATGTHVLGFGGRILESLQQNESDFKAAKYLNSPQSVVFQKKDLLFGQHMAQTIAPAEKATSAQIRPRPLIIVEGYMDAIALWQAGVKEAVASMGTALTFEQLRIAADLARRGGGRVVLCLDNDVAGLAAITRLCSGMDPIFLSVTKETDIEIFVAQLPDSAKDPAEFLEDNRAEENLDDKFRSEVIDEAQEWSKWYMDSLFSFNKPSTIDEEVTIFGNIFDALASFLSVFENVDDRIKSAAYIAPKLAELVDEDQNVTDKSDGYAKVSSTTCIQVASDLVERAREIADVKATSTQRNHLNIGTNRTSPIIRGSLEIGQDIAAEEGTRKNPSMKSKSQPTPPSLESSHLDQPLGSVSNKSKRPDQRQKRHVIQQNGIRESRKSMTKHVGGIAGDVFDEEWLGLVKDKYTKQRLPLRFELGDVSNVRRYVGPEVGVRFNENSFHGTWTTPDATAAGYMTQSTSTNLDFLEKGTSSLVESNGKDQSMSVEDLLLTVLVRFSEARNSLSESIRISQASGSGSDVQWSTPEKKWLFNCLVRQIDDIPESITGIEDMMALRSYLSNRPDVHPNAFSVIEEQPKGDRKSGEPVDASTTTIKVDGKFDQKSQEENSFSVQESSDNYPDLSSEAQRRDSELPVMSKHPTIPTIPAIGEEWSDLADGDFMPGFEDDVVSFNGIDDALIDAVGPIHFQDPEENTFSDTKNKPSSDDSVRFVDVSIMSDKEESSLVYGTTSEARANESEGEETFKRSGNIENTFAVTENGDRRGCLEIYFMRGIDSYDIFDKLYADEDTLHSGTNEDKSSWAVQDLYTMLEYTSVLKRVEAGRKFIGDRKEDRVNKTVPNDVSVELSDAKDTLASSRNDELSRYCSSTDPGGSLLGDLQRLRRLTEKNCRAADRILALMEADFTDKSVDVRGYSWLGNVLKFNELKMVEWNDIIESKENFRHSFEGFGALEEIVFSDWNELSDPNEMYEYDKNVDLNHRSHIVDVVVDRPDNESPEDFAQRFEQEWDVHSWEHERDGFYTVDNEAVVGNSDGDEEESDEQELVQDYAQDWGIYADDQME